MPIKNKKSERSVSIWRVLPFDIGLPLAAAMAVLLLAGVDRSVIAWSAGAGLAVAAWRLSTIRSS
jgi:hypothetical protein